MSSLDERDMPTPTYIRDEAKLAKQLDAQYKMMLSYLITELAYDPNNPKVIREQEILKQINFWLSELNDEMATELRKLIEKSFTEGQGFLMLSALTATTWEQALGGATMNMIQRGKVQALFSDTYQDILMATNNTSASVKKIVRDTVRKVAQYESLKGTHYREQAKKLAYELSKKGLSETVSKEGFVGITDRAGRKWDLKTYSKMVIRTKTTQAYNEGTMFEASEQGIDLAIISAHGAEDACNRWENVIVSMSGNNKDYPSYADARATNEIFHPNCRHHMNPFRKLELLPPADLAEHKRKLKALGNYKSRKYKRKSKK